MLTVTVALITFLALLFGIPFLLVGLRMFGVYTIVARPLA